MCVFPLSGSYTPMDMSELPPFWLAYLSDPSDSGRIHSNIRQRWLSGMFPNQTLQVLSRWILLMVMISLFPAVLVLCRHLLYFTSINTVSPSAQNEWVQLRWPKLVTFPPHSYFGVIPLFKPISMISVMCRSLKGKSMFSTNKRTKTLRAQLQVISASDRSEHCLTFFVLIVSVWCHREVISLICSSQTLEAVHTCCLIFVPIKVGLRGAKAARFRWGPTNHTDPLYRNWL